MVNTSDSGSRGRGFKPHLGCCVVSLSRTYLPPKKVLVIPRKRWLHPNMTEELFTGTLSIKPNQKPNEMVLKCHLIWNHSVCFLVMRILSIHFCIETTKNLMIIHGFHIKFYDSMENEKHVMENLQSGWVQTDSFFVVEILPIQVCHLLSWHFKC